MLITTQGDVLSLQGGLIEDDVVSALSLRGTSFRQIF